MDKENNRSAAGLRRSAIAERIRLREEWLELKGTTDKPLTTSNRLKQPNTLTKKVHNVSKRQNAFIPQSMRNNVFKPTKAMVHKPMSVTSEALRGVVALVEVGSESRALALRAGLTALGATVIPAWTPIVTHLVWAQGGCRATRAKARALASRLVSPLWVEACAAANKRLPEQAFPAAARASDVPSPRTLRQLLKKAEMENLSLFSLMQDKEDENEGKVPRLRISSETEHDSSADTSADTSANTTNDTSRDTTTDVESRVNTAPRRALPISMSPPKPTQAKSRRKLFTQKEAEESKTKPSDEESETETTAVRKRVRIPKPTPRERRELARAERMAKRLVAACTPAPTPAPRDYVPKIVLTGMGRAERTAVIEAIQSLKGKIQNHVTRKTTHVLLGSCRDDANDHCSGVTRKSPRNATGNLITKINNQLRLNENSCSNIRKSPRNKSIAVSDSASVFNSPVKSVKSPMKSVKSPFKSAFNISGVTNMNDNDVRVVHRSEVLKARTLNSLLGAARGCRVLYGQWAVACAAAERWIHHHGYEVPHLKKICQKARIERTALGHMRSEYAYDIFNGMRVRVSGDAGQRDAAAQLLKLCGAVLQDGGQHGGCDLTVGSGDNEVSSKWVFDSVAAARMRTTRRYINNPVANSLLTQSTNR